MVDGKLLIFMQWCLRGKIGCPGCVQRGAETEPATWSTFKL